ncbi:hypothetical protein KS4_25480 [Poriferisphaera corsica]|uniref:Uncharacterized protein n=1 Tax=Poriferisphaera corsica TaxID=2528020 RepID=A0A517YW65_9BACT|nr:hypothetical protein KS4_25480 [Poriferisphaera corsica]
MFVGEFKLAVKHPATGGGGLVVVDIECVARKTF